MGGLGTIHLAAQALPACTDIAYLPLSPCICRECAGRPAKIDSAAPGDVLAFCIAAGIKLSLSLERKWRPAPGLR